jgi:CRP/FNR family cyclic AMP-dependent transcriptional regulator
MAATWFMQQMDFFKKVPLFTLLTEAQMEKLIGVMTRKEVKSGEVIAKEGAHEDSLFILMRGEVEISKSLLLPFATESLTRQEKSLIILSEKQHPFFGEMALFSQNSERSASVTARCECTLAVIEKRDLMKILEEEPKIGSIVYKNIAGELSKRLNKANKDILKLTTAFSLALEG